MTNADCIPWAIPTKKLLSILKTLDIITEAIKAIEKNHGVIIDPLKLDITDSKIYSEIFSTGKTTGVFQFGSDGMKKILKQFKPQNFEDIIILNSMYRPGPEQFLKDVIDVKNKIKEPSYLCNELKPILEKTYGAIVYQEQVMEICQKLAGYTLGQADNVRKYMSKKKADKLAEERLFFMQNCVKNGIKESVADEIFNQMMDFASYAFNKSHAAAYSYNAFITAWLKYYYPAEFFASALNWAKDMDEVEELLYDAKNFEITIKAPHINYSEMGFCVKAGAIYYGLGNVHGVKNNATEILSKRPTSGYNDFKEFLMDVNLNSRALTNLIKGGAFDCFTTNRLNLLSMADTIKNEDYIKKIKEKRNLIKSIDFCLKYIDEQPFLDATSLNDLIALQKKNGVSPIIENIKSPEALEKRKTTAQNALDKLIFEYGNLSFEDNIEDESKKLIEEKEILGMYISKNPLDNYLVPDSVADIADIEDDSESIYGIVSNVVHKESKKGTSMAIFELEDYSGLIKCVFFYPTPIENGDVVVLTGNAKINDMEDSKVFFVSSAKYAKKNNLVYVIESDTKESFKAQKEEIKKAFYKEKGRDCYVFITSECKFYKLDFNVSEKIKDFWDVSETTLY